MMEIKSHKENRKFGLLTGGVLWLIAGFQYYKSHHVNHVLLAIGLFLILAAVTVPQMLNHLRRYWEKVGLLLGYINSLIILTVIYVLVVTPLGLIGKCFGRDPLKLKWQPEEDTYWEGISNEIETDLKRQF
jgi:hypothetical protein